MSSLERCGQARDEQETCPAAYINGTQSIDRWWQFAQDFIPCTLKGKQGKAVNPDLFRYVFAFMWRYQLDMEQDFGKALVSIS